MLLWVALKPYTCCVNAPALFEAKQPLAVVGEADFRAWVTELAKVSDAEPTFPFESWVWASTVGTEPEIPPVTTVACVWSAMDSAAIWLSSKSSQVSAALTEVVDPKLFESVPVTVLANPA
mmetsp:Transcript_42482/g.102306  ORF Transcript_42482/g.102306 Transcript_42482/m.102306 type:complete len:121 (+) Transcript_42482:168-530(+)